VEECGSLGRVGSREAGEGEDSDIFALLLLTGKFNRDPYISFQILYKNMQGPYIFFYIL